MGQMTEPGPEQGADYQRVRHCQDQRQARDAFVSCNDRERLDQVWNQGCSAAWQQFPAAPDNPHPMGSAEHAAFDDGATVGQRDRQAYLDNGWQDDIPEVLANIAREG